VTAAPVKVGLEVQRHLRAYARRGGQARARKYGPEQLKAWAALGGHAKAAKRKRAFSPAQGITGKQQ
jgi:hypothetical protein